jgi:uncharacterized sulfatase
MQTKLATTTAIVATCVIALLGDFSLAQDQLTAAQRLQKQDAQIQEAIIQVADNVYTAVGYSVSNSSIIIGDDGIVVIDTGMMPESAEQIVSEFRQITDKPVEAIIFTHSHGDHTGGASLFFGKDRPQIWAHANFGSESRQLKAAGLTFQGVRGARQAGFRLPPELRINNGVAPVRYPKRGGSVFASGKGVAPTHFLEDDSKRIVVAGIELDLVSSPGETNDQLFVWYPRAKVLFAGDNFYRSFPNLYAIRGTPQRRVRLWAESLDRLLSKDAEVLVGGHTNPVMGADTVEQVLTDYRDAVRFIHDKTVEGMNRGLTPDQLIEYVKLPEHLRSKEYLQPFYGHPEWGVRSVFNGYLGWFDGNPTNLFRLSPKERAMRIAKLVGGTQELLAQAKGAFAADDAQWTAELTDYLLALDPDHREARLLKADALTRLAKDCVNATARNYYLTVAQELRKPSE